MWPSSSALFWCDGACLSFLRRIVFGQELQEALHLRSPSRRRAPRARRCHLLRPSPSRPRQGQTIPRQTWRMVDVGRRPRCASEESQVKDIMHARSPWLACEPLTLFSGASLTPTSAGPARRINSSHAHPMNRRPSTLQKAIDSRRLSQARTTQKKKVHPAVNQYDATRAARRALTKACASVLRTRLSLGLAKNLSATSCVSADERHHRRARYRYLRDLRDAAAYLAGPASPWC